MMTHLRVIEFDQAGDIVFVRQPYAYMRKSVIRWIDAMGNKSSVQASVCLDTHHASRHAASIQMLTSYCARSINCRAVAFVACPNPDHIGGLYLSSFAAIGERNQMVVGEVNASTFAQMKTQICTRVRALISSGRYAADG